MDIMYMHGNSHYITEMDNMLKICISYMGYTDIILSICFQAVVVETPQGIQYNGRRLDASKVTHPFPSHNNVKCRDLWKCFCSPLILCCLFKHEPPYMYVLLLYALMTVISSTVRAMAEW